MSSIALRAAATVAVALAFTISIGCANSGRARADSADSALGKFQGELVSAQSQIELLDSIMGALERTQGAELEKAFKAFKKETGVLTKQANKVRSRAEAMQKKGQAYFVEWEKETAALTSESLKTAAADRRKRLTSKYGELTAAMESTGEAYRPYESSLSDIVTYLDNDLTPNGRAAIMQEIKEARQQGRDVHGRIRNVLGSSAEIRQALSAGAS